MYIYVYIHICYIYTYIILVIKKTLALLFYLDNTHKIHSFCLFFPFSDSEVNPVTLGLEETPRLTRTRLSMRTKHQKISVGLGDCAVGNVPAMPAWGPEFRSPVSTKELNCGLHFYPRKKVVGSTETHWLDGQVRSLSTRSGLSLEPLSKE